MKNYQSCLAIVLIAAMMACHQTPDKSNESSAVTTAPSGGQENVSDSLSEKDIVKVAVFSKDHTTLVAALKQADLVTALSNAGPFTVFAPTNAAFDKLPAGTVAGLMKDDKKDDLRNVLQYHVALGVLKPESFKDGQVLGMVNGDNLTVNVKDGKISLNNSAHVINSVPTSNGIIYVIDAVLLPPNK